MIVKVYQAKHPNFGFTAPDRPDPVWPDGYDLVAEVPVETDDREAAFEVAYQLTNTIEHSWWLNDGVVVRKPTPIRSTSAGDVFVVNERVFRIENIGFVEIS